MRNINIFYHIPGGYPAAGKRNRASKNKLPQIEEKACNLKTGVLY